MGLVTSAMPSRPRRRVDIVSPVLLLGAHRVGEGASDAAVATWTISPTARLVGERSQRSSGPVIRPIPEVTQVPRHRGGSLAAARLAMMVRVGGEDRQDQDAAPRSNRSA